MKLHRISTLACLALMTAFLQFSASAQNDVPPSAGSATPPPAASDNAPAVPPSGLSLMAIVSGSVDFTTFVAAVKAAGLEEALSGNGTYTLFAPHNDAFAALPDGALAALMAPANVEILKSVLNYHLLPQRMRSASLVAGRVQTVQGGVMIFAADPRGEITMQGASLIQKDVSARNGVIHSISKVLIPPTVDLKSLIAPAR